MDKNIYNSKEGAGHHTPPVARTEPSNHTGAGKNGPGKKGPGKNGPGKNGPEKTVR